MPSSPWTAFLISVISFALQSHFALAHRHCGYSSHLKTSQDVGSAEPVEGPPPKKSTKKKSVGGHEGGMQIEGDTLWKKKQDRGRGDVEEDFLKTAMNHPILSKFVPKYRDSKVMGGEEWIGMENLLFGFNEPALIDLKMGTKTWDSRASEEKIKRAQKKLQGTTTQTLGIRVIAGKFQANSGDLDWEYVGKKDGKDVKNEVEMQEVLKKFLRTAHLRKEALSKVEELSEFFMTNKQFAFAASSLFWTYDSAQEDPQEFRCKMIDFAHVDNLEGKRLDNEYLVGLQNLKKMLQNIQGP